MEENLNKAIEGVNKAIIPLNEYASTGIPLPLKICIVSYVKILESVQVALIELRDKTEL